MFDTEMEYETEHFEHSSRFDFDISEDTSFFTSRSPPSSPRPFPCSPSHDSHSNLLPMEEDFIDLNSFIEKENKPFSPARKRLNFNGSNDHNSPASKNILQTVNVNLCSSPFRINPLKRSESSDSSPVQNKRHRSENTPPASISSTSSPSNRSRKTTISIMNVLTSSSEHLRKNRL